MCSHNCYCDDIFCEEEVCRTIYIGMHIECPFARTHISHKQLIFCLQLTKNALVHSLIHSFTHSL